MTTQSTQQDNPQAIRQEILELVNKYYHAEFGYGEFIPGKTRIGYSGRVFDEREMVAATDALLDFWLTLGQWGDRFEKELARYLKSKFVSLVNSGSSANLVAVASLMSQQLGRKRLVPGDEAITPAVTFPTTFNPLVQLGLVPVLIDVEADTYNLDVSLLENALSERTRLIMVPHTLGNPCDIKRIVTFAREHDLYLIEDSCDALGSTVDGKMVGTFGDLGTFSFYPAHQITLGEGGAVVTQSSKLDRIVRSLREWGKACYCAHGEMLPFGACGRRFQWRINGVEYDHRYMYDNIGYNLKPLDIQAAIGMEQLRKLPEFAAVRRRNFQRLYQLFSQYEDFFILPRTLPGTNPVFFAFPLSVRPEAPFSRKEFATWLEEHNIETRVIFAGNIIHHKAYKYINYRVAGKLQHSDSVLRDSFFIGLYPGIDEQRMAFIEEVATTFLNRFGAR